MSLVEPVIDNLRKIQPKEKFAQRQNVILVINCRGSQNNLKRGPLRSILCVFLLKYFVVFSVVVLAAKHSVSCVRVNVSSGITNMGLLNCDQRG